jgi:hypothetical protein
MATQRANGTRPGVATRPPSHPPPPAARAIFGSKGTASWCYGVRVSPRRELGPRSKRPGRRVPRTRTAVRRPLRSRAMAGELQRVPAPTALVGELVDPACLAAPATEIAARQRSPGTRRTYAAVYRSFGTFLGPHATVEELTAEAVRAYRDALERAGFDCTSTAGTSWPAVCRAGHDALIIRLVRRGSGPVAVSARPGRRGRRGGNWRCNGRRPDRR